MTSTNRIAKLAAALSIGFAASLNAQALATFGSAELAGFGEGSALLGTSITTGHPGLGPMATLVGQTYRYQNGPGSHAQAYAISPSIGLQYSMPTGAVSAGVGYTFVNTQFDGLISGADLGGRNGTFATAQGNYWATARTARSSSVAGALPRSTTGRALGLRTGSRPQPTPFTSVASSCCRALPTAT